MHHFSRSQSITKPATSAMGGIVAAQHRRAAEIGVEVLRAGGHAVDAAVATSFAMGVLEPWMSGPAGGGAAMVWDASAGRAHALFYGMRSPAGLDPADFPLTGEENTAGDLFPWKAVKDDRNVTGATAVAVPGVVDGIGLAHRRFGRMAWAQLVRPSVELAREGLLVDWYAALRIAATAKALSLDADAARIFLEDGRWPVLAGWTASGQTRLPLPGLADTLEAIAQGGPRELYEGDVAQSLARDVEAKGGSLRLSDLRAYRAEWQDPLAFAYRGGRFFVTPRLTAGPTIRSVFEKLEARLAPGAEPGAETYEAYATSLHAAYEERLSSMGDNEAPTAPSSTTHFSVVDRDGNMVALTQTLLSVFGSRVVSPSTGLLLNNGIMWFDPEQGKANSLGPAKRCLMNVCPLIGEADGRRFALGASGGRKIMPAVAQLASFLTDHAMSLDRAFHQPRIDVSGGDTTIADEDLAPEILTRLGGSGKLQTAKRLVYPYAFACPAGVMREGETNFGATEIMSPWGEAVAE